jgi:hypothetical protein
MLDAEQERDAPNLNHAVGCEISAPPNEVGKRVQSIGEGLLESQAEFLLERGGWIRVGQGPSPVDPGSWALL